MSAMIKRESVSLAFANVESDDENSLPNTLKWLSTKDASFQARLRAVKESANTLEGPLAILQILPSESIIALKPAFFSEDPQGLELKSFVKVLLSGVSRYTSIPREARPQVAVSLAQLFRDIDTDASGYVSWSEFSHYTLEVIKRILGTAEYAAVPFQPVPIGRALPRSHKTSKITFHDELGMYIALEPTRVLIVPDPSLTAHGYMQGLGPVIPGIYARTLRLPHHAEGASHAASDFVQAAKRVRAYAHHLRSSLAAMRTAITNVGPTPATAAAAARIERSLQLADARVDALARAEERARVESARSVVIEADKMAQPGAGAAALAATHLEMFAVDKVDAPCGDNVTAYAYCANDNMLFVACDSGVVQLYMTDTVHSTRPHLTFFKSVTLPSAAGALAWHSEIQLLVVGDRRGLVLGVDFLLDRRSALVETVLEIEAHAAPVKDIVILPHTALLARAASAAPDPIAPVVLSDLMSGVVLMTLGGPGSVQLGLGTTGLGSMPQGADEGVKSLLDPSRVGGADARAGTADANREARARAEAELQNEAVMQDASVVVRMQRKRHWKGALLCVFHPGAQVLVTAGFDLEPKVWIPHPLRQSFASALRDEEFPHKTTIVALVPLNDGFSLLSADAFGLIKIWDLRHAACTGSFELEPHQSRLQKISFKCISVTYDRKRHRLIACAVDESSCTRTYYFDGDTSLAQLREATAHDGPVTRVLWSPAVRSVLSLSFGEMRLWSPASGVSAQTVALELPGGDITAVAFDPTARRVFAASLGGTVGCFSVATGTLITPLPGVYKDVTAMSYVLRASALAIACAGGLWHLVSEKGVRSTVSMNTYGIPLVVEDSEYSSLLVVADDAGVIAVYDANAVSSQPPVPVAELCHNTQPPAPRTCAQSTHGRVAALQRMKADAAHRVATQKAQISLAMQRTRGAAGAALSAAAREEESAACAAATAAAAAAAAAVASLAEAPGSPGGSAHDSPAGSPARPTAGRDTGAQRKSTAAAARLRASGGLGAFEGESTPAVVAVTFLDPYPILAACDTTGRVVFWRTRSSFGTKPSQTAQSFTYSAASSPRSGTSMEAAFPAGGAGGASREPEPFTCICAVEVPRPQGATSSDRIVPVGSRIAWFPSHHLIVVGDDAGGVSWISVRPLLRGHNVQPLVRPQAGAGGMAAVSQSGTCVRSMAVAGASRLPLVGHSGDGAQALLPVLVSHSNAHGKPILDVAAVDATLSSSLSGDVSRAEVTRGTDVDAEGIAAVVEEENVMSASADATLGSRHGGPAGGHDGSGTLDERGGDGFLPHIDGARKARRGGVMTALQQAGLAASTAVDDDSSAPSSPTVPRQPVGKLVVPVSGTGRRLSFSTVAGASNEWGSTDDAERARKRFRQLDRGIVVITADAGGRAIVWTLGGRMVSELRQSRVTKGDDAILDTADAEARELAYADPEPLIPLDGDGTDPGTPTTSRRRQRRHGAASGPRWSMKEVSRLILEVAKADPLAAKADAARARKAVMNNIPLVVAPDVPPVPLLDGESIQRAVDAAAEELTVVAAARRASDASPPPADADATEEPIITTITIPNVPPPPPAPVYGLIEGLPTRVVKAPVLAPRTSAVTPDASATPRGLPFRASFAEVSTSLISRNVGLGGRAPLRLPQRTPGDANAASSAPAGHTRSIFRAAVTAIGMQATAGRSAAAMRRRVRGAERLAAGTLGLDADGDDDASDDGADDEDEGPSNAEPSAPGPAAVPQGVPHLSLSATSPYGSRKPSRSDGGSVSAEAPTIAIAIPLLSVGGDDLAPSDLTGAPSAPTDSSARGAPPSDPRRKSFVPLWDVVAPDAVGGTGDAADFGDAAVVAGDPAGPAGFWTKDVSTVEQAVDVIAPSPPPSRPPSPCASAMSTLAPIRVSLVRVGLTEEEIEFATGSAPLAAPPPPARVLAAQPQGSDAPRVGRGARRGSASPSGVTAPHPVADLADLPVGARVHVGSVAGTNAASALRTLPNEAAARALVRPATVRMIQAPAAAFTAAGAPLPVDLDEESYGGRPFSWAEGTMRGGSFRRQSHSAGPARAGSAYAAVAAAAEASAARRASGQSVHEGPCSQRDGEHGVRSPHVPPRTHARQFESAGPLNSLFVAPAVGTGSAAPASAGAPAARTAACSSADGPATLQAPLSAAPPAALKPVPSVLPSAPSALAVHPVATALAQAPDTGDAAAAATTDSLAADAAAALAPGDPNLRPRRRSSTFGGLGRAGSSHGWGGSRAGSVSSPVDAPMTASPTAGGATDATELAQLAVTNVHGGGGGGGVVLRAASLGVSGYYAERDAGNSGDRGALAAGKGAARGKTRPAAVDRHGSAVDCDDGESSDGSACNACVPSAAVILAAAATVLASMGPCRTYPQMRDATPATLSGLTAHIAERARAARLRSKQLTERPARLDASAVPSGAIIIGPAVHSAATGAAPASRAAVSGALDDTATGGGGTPLAPTRVVLHGPSSVEGVLVATAGMPADVPVDDEVRAAAITAMSSACLTSFVGTPQDLAASPTHLLVPDAPPAVVMERQRLLLEAAAREFAARLGPTAAEALDSAQKDSSLLAFASRRALKCQPQLACRAAVPDNVRIIPPAPLSALSPVRAAQLRRDPYARSYTPSDKVIDPKGFAHGNLRMKYAAGVPTRARPVGIGLPVSPPQPYVPKPIPLPYTAPPIAGVSGPTAESIHKAVVDASVVVASAPVPSAAARGVSSKLFG